MNAPHPLDGSRLEILRQKQHSAIAASREVHEQYMVAHKTVGDLQARLRALGGPDYAVMGISEISKRKSAILQEIAVAEAEKSDLYARWEESKSRGQVVGSLYTRCANFMGVDPYAR